MSDYWKKRQQEKLSGILDNADISSKEIAKYYQKATFYLNEKIQGIFDKYKLKNGLSNQEAKILLNSLINSHDYDEMLNKLRNATSEERKDLLKKLDSQAFRYRIQRLQKIQSEIDTLMKEGYKIERDINANTIIDNVYEGYHKSIYNLQKSTNVAFQFDNLDPSLVESFLRSNWSGKNFSDRVWSNTQKLADSLKDEFMIGLLTGKTEKEMARSIAERFSVHNYHATVLVRTESAAAAAFADQLAFEDAGIDKEIFRAVHDFRTSEVCQKHDGSIVKLKNYQVGVNVPPMHPQCRSHMEPIIDEEITRNLKRRVRNPITGKDEIVNANETYDQWLKRMQKNHSTDTVETFQKKVKNRGSDKKQFKRYKDVLGEEYLPNSLDKFQDLKYNSDKDWTDLKALYRATNNGWILQDHLDYAWNGEKGFIPTGAALTNIHTIAGKGSDTKLRVADVLADEYGGSSDDWSKKVAKVTSDKYIFDIHWYELDKKQYKAKVKMRKDRN